MEPGSGRAMRDQATEGNGAGWPEPDPSWQQETTGGFEHRHDMQSVAVFGKGTRLKTRRPFHGRRERAKA